MSAVGNYTRGPCVLHAEPDARSRAVVNVPAGVATWDHGTHPNLPWTFISIAGADHLRGWVENACVGVTRDPVSGIAYSRQSHLDVPPTPKVRGTRLDPTRCAYEDHNWSSAPNAVRCAGPLEVSHDSRGCAWVCRAHALWRQTLSVAAGHSKDCPRPGEPFRWRSQQEIVEARSFVDHATFDRRQLTPPLMFALAPPPVFARVGQAASRAAPDLDAAFYDAWTAMARRLGADPLDMARIAHAESGMNPRAFHPGSNAGGLIGFMPSILRGLGWTGSPEEFRQLSATEQVPYVERYYRPYAGRLNNEGLIYVANFLPSRLPDAARSDDSFVVSRSGDPYYADNRVLDRNGDGTITVGDLRAHLAIQNRGGRYEAIASELRARGGGGSSPSGPAIAAARRAVPIATVAALAATGALVWYFYATDDGARMRQRAERRLDDLFGAA